ncbi:uncharacterized protein PRCAT00006081001 [Priceomyces carsonii]|uniref:uncharacterized protein n=1 Tax=Priceomyces carsonii TaxID=28549 RepID=UPI002EDAC27E|nr:unnamed protein product [Priceomyces carsonii]
MSRIESDSEVLLDDGDSRDLEDFIVDELELHQGNEQQRDVKETVHRDLDNNEKDELPLDRILKLNSELKPNEMHAQKLLKAHIAVLVSALGGPDHTSSVQPPPYKLGHDAHACLKDLKRWIRSVDEKNNSFDVALACADSGLVVNDLTVILCQWNRQQSLKKPTKNARSMERIMLSCLELLVLLTWPIEISKDLSEAQKLSFASTKKTQIIYKKHILEYCNGQTLEAVIRLVLPTIAKDRIDREPRDNAIIRLVLFLIRNILYIEPAESSISTKARKGIIPVDNLPSNITYDDISMNSVLSAFQKNKVLTFLLTLSGTVGKDFDKEAFSQACLECVYLILKGIKPEHVLMPMRKKAPQQVKRGKALPEIQSLNTSSGLQLKELLNQEATRKKVQTQHISTRHGRFGSLLSIQGNDTSYVISGQEALVGLNSSLEKLDKSKKWNVRSQFKYDSDEFVSHRQEFLNDKSVLILKEFIEQFLVTGCFNNLIENLSWLLSGSTDFNYIDEYEKATFFLTVAWFFSYKRERIVLFNKGILNLSGLSEDDDTLDYGSVGAALSEVNFILIISYFRESFSLRRWSSLHVAMICFYEMLMISYSLFTKRSNNSNGLDLDDDQEETDREMAEGIIRKLFSFSDFLSILTKIPQTASKHSPEYLRVSISVVHIILKSFESFASEDVKLYIQSKRRKSKANKRLRSGLDKHTEDSMRDVIEESDEELTNERAKEVTRERRLDFEATEAGFFRNGTVSTYIEYLSRFEDLTHEEIKKCMTYFHRLFVSKRDHTALYRIDFMHILYKLRTHLPRESHIRGHVEEFTHYFMKKFKVAFDRFPIPIEVLFLRFEDLELNTYLASGDLYIRPDVSSKNNKPKLAKELEFIRDFNKEEKIKILVSVLFQQEKDLFIAWLLNDLKRILEEKILDEDLITKLSPTPQFNRLLINNPYIRLLLKIMGFDLPYIMEELCELPASVAPNDLAEVIELIKKWKEEQPVNFEDSRDPAFFLRAKETYGYGDYDDVDYLEGGNDDADESIAFETSENITGSRRNFHELDKLDELEEILNKSNSYPRGLARIKSKPKKNEKRTSKVYDGKVNGEHEDRRTSSHLRNEKVDIVRSAKFVHDSDDESDDEKGRVFYEREERLRTLLKNSGGIVDSRLLAEFKKAWSQIEDVTPNSISMPLLDLNDIHSKSSNVPSNDESIGLVEPALSDENTTNTDTSFSSFRQNEETQVLLDKRARLVTDDTDNEDEILEHQPKKHKSQLTSRKKIVISDDEDDN